MNGLEDTSALKSTLLQTGTEVLQGRFKVIELLGRGGMGDVYLAEQVSLGRKVALKTLRDDLSAQPGMTDRFKREALLLSSVDHPSVVRVIDFGEAQKTYVLVMEYVEGENLALAVREGAFDPARALPVLKDIAEGLEAIHTRGIVHRDLKLDNVLLTKTGSVERARLLDFGIARLAESDGGPGGSMTQAGLVLGTPEYLAPEQAMGGKIDARTDVYAFGILAYRMLTGRHPFPGPSAREFLLQHISVDPPDLTAFSPHLAAHGGLVRLVMQCLRKKPDERPDGGRGLLAALNALDKSAVTAPLATPGVGTPTAVARTPRPSAPELAAMAAPVVKAAVVETTKRLKAMPRRTLQLGIGVAVLIAAALLIIPKLTKDPTFEKATALLDAGKPGPALELIDAAKGSNEPPLRLLRAEAYHQQKRHTDEWALVGATPSEGLSKMRPALLSFLLDDYAKNRDEDAIRAVLSALPKDQADIVREWAKGPLSAAQWGALRWADQRRMDGVDLGAGYIVSLESSDCDVAATAAKRLGELGDTRAIDGLRRLATSPRKEGFLFFARSCGHDEAAQALRKLNASGDDSER
jgi:predicted Ser/Thr protein kinase